MVQSRRRLASVKGDNHLSPHSALSAVRLLHLFCKLRFLRIAVFGPRRSMCAIGSEARMAAFTSLTGYLRKCSEFTLSAHVSHGHVRSETAAVSGHPRIFPERQLSVDSELC